MFDFTSKFWKRFHNNLGTRLHSIIAYHPQSDAQSERTIQTLKDMLSCVFDFNGIWGSYLPLVEFSNKNRFHSSIGIPPFMLLYESRFQTLICWDEVG